MAPNIPSADSLNGLIAKLAPSSIYLRVLEHAFMSRFWTKLSRTVVALSMLAAAMAAFVHVEHGHAGDHPDASDCPICIAIHSAAALDL
ncbi:MAG: hypothetical protein KDA32_04670, partial [Phycisphaerales bacterium]|nr:hypothetical protein [Phycisphaerales bacterium]